MRRFRLAFLFLVLVLAAAIPACGGGVQKDAPEKIGKYTLFATKTDQVDSNKAKTNAADVLTKLADEKNVCLIGLWAYNAPMILRATEEIHKEGKVHIVGFDEKEDTLRGVREGHIEGTVVQQPYEFGYQSVRIMAYLLKHPGEPLPEEIEIGDDKVHLTNGKYHVPHKVITKGNVDAFQEKLKEQIKLGKAEAPKGSEGKIRVALVTNNADEFWTFAEAGTRAAATKFDVQVEFRRPQSGTAADQQTIIRDLLNSNVQAIAISVNDAANQKSFLDDEIAARVPLITFDNDAPETKRKCYIGTDNVAAGNAAGKLVKKAMPDGGTVAIFVGHMDSPNAQERHKGVTDELAKE